MDEFNVGPLSTEEIALYLQEQSEDKMRHKHEMCRDICRIQCRAIEYQAKQYGWSDIQTQAEKERTYRSIRAQVYGLSPQK